MVNLKIYRGPTHDIPNLPQFAPDRSIYDMLPKVDLIEQVKANPESFKLIHENKPGIAKCKDFLYFRNVWRINC